MTLSNQRGAIISIVVLLAAGQSYRVAASWLGSADTSVAIPVGTLSRLPSMIGNWRGEDMPLDVQTIRRTDTDDHVNRCYSHDNGRDAVGVFFAYGVRTRDLLPHRPEVCYPGAGWTLVHTKQRGFIASDGRLVNCRVYDFIKGGLQSDSVTVLNFFIVDGTSHADVASLRSRAWRSRAARGYIARVQISSLTVSGEDSMEPLVLRFAADAVGPLFDLLEEATRSESSVLPRT
jgi:hypothetical protein